MNDLTWQELSVLSEARDILRRISDTLTDSRTGGIAYAASENVQTTLIHLKVWQEQNVTDELLGLHSAKV